MKNVPFAAYTLQAVWGSEILRGSRTKEDDLHTVGISPPFVAFVILHSELRPSSCAPIPRQEIPKNRPENKISAQANSLIRHGLKTQNFG